MVGYDGGDGGDGGDRQARGRQQVAEVLLTQ
jgi:hypothetical protein